MAEIGRGGSCGAWRGAMPCRTTPRPRRAKCWAFKRQNLRIPMFCSAVRNAQPSTQQKRLGNDMQGLRNSADLSATPDVQPGMHPLRRSADSIVGSFTHSHKLMQAAPPSHAGALAEIRPQRSGNSGVGERPAGRATRGGADWPGRGHGVRQPDPFETPLSWGEVMHGVRLGLIGWGWR